MLRRLIAEEINPEITIIASDCGFNERVALLSRKIFGNHMSIKIVSSKVATELRENFAESEKAALAVLHQYSDRITDGDWQTIEKLETSYQEGKIEVNDYPAQK